MMAATVSAYLDTLSADRREAISAVRTAILNNLQSGFEEGIQYGMIGYFVPHSVYPKGYRCDPKEPLPFLHLASRKGYVSLYLNSQILTEDLKTAMEDSFKKAGKKFEPGRACVRFKDVQELPLEALGAAIRRVSVGEFIVAVEAGKAYG